MPKTELSDILPLLSTQAALAEFALIAACLALAWAVVRVVRGAQPRLGSIWFGERIVDGVLFPVLALLAVLAARYAFAATMTVGVLRLAVPVLGSLVLIRIAVRVLRAAFPNSGAMRAVERTLSWFVWGVLVLWLTGLLPLVLKEMESVHWKLGGTDVSLRSLIEGAVSAVAVLLLMLWLSAAIEHRLLRGTLGDLSLRKIAANATRAILLLIGMLLALSAAGIPLAALSVLGGAVGVGIGFGLQKLAANYVSGFVILAERSLRIGDMVKVDNFEGRISDITTRYTVIRALNGRESIVPNEILMTQRVENSSLADSKVLLNTVVQVAYGTDIDALLPTLTDVVARVSRVLADPGPAVHLTSFASDGLELTVWFWIGDPHNGQSNVRSEVNLAVLRSLNGLGIGIPYPQRVVHSGAAPIK
jgi:small-conductance mechanosensitive channel